MKGLASARNGKAPASQTRYTIDKSAIYPHTNKYQNPNTVHELRDLGRAKPSAGFKTFVKLKPRTAAKSVLSEQLRGKPLIEPSVPAVASRAAASTAAGDDTLRNRIEPMHGQRRTLQKRLERQPASAVTTSPSAGWTCASARPRTAVATLPS